MASREPQDYVQDAGQLPEYAVDEQAQNATLASVMSAEMKAAIMAKIHANNPSFAKLIQDSLDQDPDFLDMWGLSFGKRFARENAADTILKLQNSTVTIYGLDPVSIRRYCNMNAHNMPKKLYAASYNIYRKKLHQKLIMTYQNETKSVVLDPGITTLIAIGLTATVDAMWVKAQLLSGIEAPFAVIVQANRSGSDEIKHALGLYYATMVDLAKEIFMTKIKRWGLEVGDVSREQVAVLMGAKSNSLSVEEYGKILFFDVNGVNFVYATTQLDAREKREIYRSWIRTQTRG